MNVKKKELYKQEIAKMNKQEIMAEHTKLAAKELYGIIELNVEFPYHITSGFHVYGGECTYHKDKTIRFNGAIFKEDELDDWAWYIILHELTHIKILGHSEEFWAELENNFEKTTGLRNRFYNEAGIDGDSYTDMDYYIYDDAPVINSLNGEIEYDYENLDYEDEYFDTYSIFGETK